MDEEDGEPKSMQTRVAQLAESGEEPKGKDEGLTKAAAKALKTLDGMGLTPQPILPGGGLFLTLSNWGLFPQVHILHIFPSPTPYPLPYPHCSSQIAHL